MARRPFEYRGFISYSHRDEAFAKWLHGALETYSIPRKLRGTIGRDGPVPPHLFKIYRDRDENPTASDLGAVIADALRKSTYLIVLCSPSCARSQWVEQEILEFKKLGRENHVLAVIIDGEPNASSKAGVDPEIECFPHALRFRFDPETKALSDSPTEPIAADARPHGDGRYNTKLKLVAGLLGVSYDAIRRRDDGRRRRRWLAVCALLAMVVGAGGLRAWELYDRGELTAESEPANSSISVDGAELGSKIKGLKLATGTHLVTAAAPDHFELERQVRIDRQRTASTRFSLEPGWEAQPYRSSDLQGSFGVIETADDVILVNNELTQLSMWSAMQGRVIAAIPTPRGEHRSFDELRLGDGPRRFFVSAIEPAGLAPEAVVIPSEDPASFWTAKVPSSARFPADGAMASIAFSGPDGDVLGLAGRDGKVYLFDAASGNFKTALELSKEPLTSPPSLALTKRGGMRLYAALRSVGGDLRLLSLSASGDAGQTKSLFRGKGWAAQFVSPEADRALLWNDNQWRLIDPELGNIVASGTIAGPLRSAPLWLDAGPRDGPSLLLDYQSELGTVTVRIADGVPLWTAPKGFRPLRTSSGSAVRQGNALLLGSASAIAAVEAQTGIVRWRHEGVVAGVLAGSWSGDGGNQVLATVEGEGLICLNESGTLLWKLRLGTSNLAPVALVRSPGGGLARDIVLQSHGGAIGLVHGPRRLWLARSAKPLQASPAVLLGPNGGSVVAEVGEWDGRAKLRAFDGVTGTVLWSATDEIAPNRGVAVGDLDGNGIQEFVAIGLGHGDARGTFILSYNPTDGRLLSALPVAVDGWLSSTPVIADFRGIGRPDVAFSAWDAQLIALADGKTGEVIWRFSTAGPVLGAVSAGDIDGDGKPDVLVSSFDGYIYALRGADGNLLWKQSIGPGGWTSPTVIGGKTGARIAVTDLVGGLHVLDAQTGKVLWVSQSREGAIKPAGSPIALQLDKRMLVYAPQGALGLVAYDLDTGAIAWTTDDAVVVSASPVLWNSPAGRNLIVCATVDGTLLFLEAETGALIRREELRDKDETDPLIEGDPVVADLTGTGELSVVIATHDRQLLAVRGSGIAR